MSPVDPEAEVVARRGKPAILAHKIQLTFDGGRARIITAVDARPGSEHDSQGPPGPDPAVWSRGDRGPFPTMVTVVRHLRSRSRIRTFEREALDRASPHRGLGLDVPLPNEGVVTGGRITRHARLGGLINEYSRLAA